MIGIDHQLDDLIREMVKDAVDNLSREDIKNLANSQARKFWEVLRMEKNSLIAYRLALHQFHKADKEIENYTKEIKWQERKGRDCAKARSNLSRAEVGKTFWEKVKGVVDDNFFLKQLQSWGKKSLNEKSLLSLQLLFAETLYCELIYLKAINSQAGGNR